MGYRVGTEMRGTRKVYTLHDDSTGSSAAILPSFGFNLFDLRLPVAAEVRPLIVTADDFAENPRGGAGNGTPILFPFPNRIRAGTYTFRGRSFRLPINHAPNSIHGFAVDAPWDVVEQGAGPGEAFLIGRFRISRNARRLSSSWPADATIEVRYGLSGRRLTMTITVSNPSAADLPYGFGIHPYFRLPFAAGGDTARTLVALPASKYWVLEDFLPTGEIRPVDDRLDFRAGRPIRGLKLDDVLTGLDFAGPHAVCRLVDLDQRAEFQLRFDRAFRELVVYTPPGRPGVISLEPYTQATDAINLHSKGIEAGLRILKPGARETLALTMETKG